MHKREIKEWEIGKPNDKIKINPFEPIRHVDTDLFDVKLEFRAGEENSIDIS